MTNPAPVPAAGPPDESNPFGALYDEAVSRLLDVPVTETWVDTRVGRTHVLTAGERTAPPVVVFQGGNVTTPVTLTWVQSLAADYHVVAPDTVGEPGKSHPERPDQYCLLVADVLERALAHVFTEPIVSIDECVVETIGLALPTGDLAAEFPGHDDQSALIDFRAPTLVVTGERDPFFPGERTCDRASDVLPSLENCVELEAERHLLSERGQASATAAIRSFLATATDER